MNIAASIWSGINYVKKELMAFVEYVDKKTLQEELNARGLPNKTDEYRQLMEKKVAEFIEEVFPEVKELAEKPKLFKRLVDYTVTKVVGGDWELSKENKAFGKLVGDYAKIEDASDFTAIKIGLNELKEDERKNITEYERKYEEGYRMCALKAIAKKNETGEYYAISINLFGDNEIRGYLSNLYRPICKTENVECAPEIVMIYNDKKDDFYLGSRFIDKKFQTFLEWRKTAGKDKCGLAAKDIRIRVSYADFLKEWNKDGKTNIGKILASVMFLSDYDPHLSNVMFDADSGLFATIDHDGSFLNLYTTQWQDLKKLVGRVFIFDLNDGTFPMADLLKALEAIVKLTEEELAEELNGHIELLNSLGLGTWSEDIQLPMVPEFQFNITDGRIQSYQPEAMKGLVELLKKRQAVFADLVAVLKVEAVIQGDDLDAFKQLEKEGKVKLQAASDWFGVYRQKKPLELAVHYKADAIYEYLLEKETTQVKFLTALDLKDEGMFKKYWAKASKQEKVEFISQSIDKVRSYELGVLLLQDEDLQQLEKGDQLLIVAALYKETYLRDLIKFLEAGKRGEELKKIKDMVRAFMQNVLFKKGEGKVLDLDAVELVLKDGNEYHIKDFLLDLKGMAPESFHENGIRIVKLLLKLGKHRAILNSDRNEFFCELFSKDKDEVFLEYVQLYVESGIRNQGRIWGSEFEYKEYFLNKNVNFLNRLDGLSPEEKESLRKFIEARADKLLEESNDFWVSFNPVYKYLKAGKREFEGNKEVVLNYDYE